MDKSWINCQTRISPTYLNGVEQFLNFAMRNNCDMEEILCPCKSCCNCVWLDRENVHEHLLRKGFLPSYKIWDLHGENPSSIDLGNIHNEDALLPNLAQETCTDNRSHRLDDMDALLQDMRPYISEENEVTTRQQTQCNDKCDEGSFECQNPIDGFHLESEKFYKLINDGQEDLYPGCKKFSKLSFIIRLFIMKGAGGWTNTSFTSLLGLLREAFDPIGVKLPKTYEETRTTMRGLGLDYKRIDACINDCMLFRNYHQEDNFCSVCGACRWVTMAKDKNVVNETNLGSFLTNNRKIPEKVHRHFPLKPRLQRLFMCPETAQSMTWHHKERIKDAKMRHPADSEAWRAFDSLNQEFASDPRNVRLGLASDGFNPYRTMNTNYTMWPVVLFPYNLPPWLCMKQDYFIMSLLIPGGKSPDDNIDVYLKPLIEELQDLWVQGLVTFDAFTKETFRMHASLLWTISDFPAFSMLSRWPTKGKFACPVCSYDTCSKYLNYSRKTVYLGHRRFLKKRHKFRNDQRSFYGGKEMRDAPVPLKGEDILKRLESFYDTPTSSSRKRKRSDDIIWKKKSIFFDIPYWKDNVIRHNLDVMHIEKNFGESLIGTLLDIPGKSKDHENARRDLQDLNIRSELHPQDIGGDDVLLPVAPFQMSRKGKNTFCQILLNAKVPNGHSSNISRCVQLKECKISGLKSHDYHFIIHHLLGIAVKNSLRKEVVEPIIRLGEFFKTLCGKVLDVETLEKLEIEIAEILCSFEKIFPPSFFDIMVHLPIHLAREAKLGGPVQFRWMYSSERYLCKLKSLVRSRSRPEASIAEGYLVDECMTFCRRYLHESVSSSFKKTHEKDDVSNTSFLFPKKCVLNGKGHFFELDEDTWLKAHCYVLFNCDAISQYRSEHEQLMQEKCSKTGKSRKWAEAQQHSQEFYQWFEVHVKDKAVSEEIKWLSKGPDFMINKDPLRKELSGAQKFILTRTNKDNCLCVDDESKEEVDILRKSVSGQEESEVDTSKILNMLVKPKSGRVPLHGRGVTPSQVIKVVEKKQEDEALVEKIKILEAKDEQKSKEIIELRNVCLSMMKCLQVQNPNMVIPSILSCDELLSPCNTKSAPKEKTQPSLPATHSKMLAQDVEIGSEGGEDEENENEE